MGGSKRIVRVCGEQVPSAVQALTPSHASHDGALQQPCMQSGLPHQTLRLLCVRQMVFAECGIGAIVLTANVILLGGDIVFFQSLCLLGYCLFPICIAAIICASFNQHVSVGHRRTHRHTVTAPKDQVALWETLPCFSVPVTPSFYGSEILCAPFSICRHSGCGCLHCCWASAGHHGRRYPSSAVQYHRGKTGSFIRSTLVKRSTLVEGSLFVAGVGAANRA